MEDGTVRAVDLGEIVLLRRPYTRSGGRVDQVDNMAHPDQRVLPLGILTPWPDGFEPSHLSS